MFISDVCQLTTRDYTILEVMQERRFGNDELMRAILQRKLTNAIVMFRTDIPPTVVTLDSRVTYRVDDGPAETRIVADNEMRGLVGMTVISITHPRGLAMLGVAEGDSVTLQRSGDIMEKITVVKVVHQPEAAKRAAHGKVKADRVFQKPALADTPQLVPVFEVQRRTDSNIDQYGIR